MELDELLRRVRMEASVSGDRDTVYGLDGLLSELDGECCLRCGRHIDACICAQCLECSGAGRRSAREIDAGM